MFQAKNFLITGAGSGIGRGIAEALVNKGAVVYALDKSEESLLDLKNKNEGVHTICQDISDWEGTKKSLRDLPAVDGLVNCAAVLIFAHFLDIDPNDLDKILGVNLKGTICVCQCVAEKMIGRQGSIVNVSSTSALKFGPGYMAYAASKAALDHVTRGMANELGPSNIRVNSVNPTLTPETKMGKMIFESRADPKDVVPLGRWNRVEDVVETVLFLLSDASSMITGTVLPVDGGQLTR